MEAIVGIVISALISASVSGLLVYYIRRYIDGKIDGEQQDRAARDERRRKMNAAERKRRQAAGRLMFWLYHAVVKGEHNGELEEAMENYQTAEREQKAIDREILAEIEDDLGVH